jgi:hypothetical protein
MAHLSRRTVILSVLALLVLLVILYTLFNVGGAVRRKR